MLAILAASVLIHPSAYSQQGPQQTAGQRLARSLSNASDFRVRAQSAFALGNTRQARYRPTLEAALHDRSSAVRAAAAAALGRLGVPAAIPALRRLRGDASGAVRSQAQRSIAALTAPRAAAARSNRPSSSATPSTTRAAAPAPAPSASSGAPLFQVVAPLPTHDVRWRDIDYLVFIGEVRNNAELGGTMVESHVANHVDRALRGVNGVASRRLGQELDRRDQRAVTRNRIPRLRIQANVLSLSARNIGSEIAVEAEVALVFLDDQSRTMRSVLQGAATARAARPTVPAVMRRTLAALAERSLEGAVGSALQNAQQALRASVSSRDRRARRNNRR